MNITTKKKKKKNNKKFKINFKNQLLISNDLEG